MKVYYKQVQLNPTTATDYTDLLNKPQINGVELVGDQDTEQIKVTWYGTQAEFDALGTYSPTTFYIIDDGIPVGMQADYLDLANKPSINGQVLTGNKLSGDLSMYTSAEIDNMLASLRSIKVVSALPSAPLANTMYYVGPDSEGVYMVYLYDSLLNRIDLGPSVQKLYTAGKAIEINEATNVIGVKTDDDTIKLNTSNALYVPDATNSQKGVVKYDDNTIRKDVNGNLYVPEWSPAATNTAGFLHTDNSAIEIGKYVDFHNNNSSADYDGRLYLLDQDSNAKGDLYFTNKYDSSRSGFVLTRGNSVQTLAFAKSSYITEAYVNCYVVGKMAIIQGGFRPSVNVGTGSMIGSINGITFAKNEVGWCQCNDNGTVVNSYFLQTTQNSNTITARDIAIPGNHFYWFSLMAPIQ